MITPASAALSEYDLIELVRFRAPARVEPGTPALWRWPFEDPALNARASTFAGIGELLREHADAVDRWQAAHPLDASALLADHAEEARRREVDGPLWGVMHRESGRIRAVESFVAARAEHDRTREQPVVRDCPGAAWRVPLIGEAYAATQPLPAQVRAHVDAAVGGCSPRPARSRTPIAEPPSTSTPRRSPSGRVPR